MMIDIQLLVSSRWKDYELLDCGDGQKLERFGAYVFVRPEVQALWPRRLPPERWESAHATFHPSGEESGGHWVNRKMVPDRWEMNYGSLRFSVMTTPGRHLGVFPECAANWDWMSDIIREGREKTSNTRPLRILNLFGYTGLATLAAAAAGANVTHVDASRKSIAWARQNQSLSRLEEKPVRWIEDDALKFVQREIRRGNQYDGILLDPPKFGRGPKGEVWEVYKSLPELLNACKQILSDHPLFVILTIYAVKFPAIHAYEALSEIMRPNGGRIECGELVTEESSGGRSLSQAVYARWGNM